MSFPPFFQNALVGTCILFCACSNSISPTDLEKDSSYQSIAYKEQNSPKSGHQPEFWQKHYKACKENHPLQDTIYPFSGIPRIAIETQWHEPILDREAEIPATLLIYGETEAESDTMQLVIRGRGNSSWQDMPKHSFKIELAKKYGFFGMPKDKDWVLIANYADKTLMKNFLAFRHARDINMNYAPKSEFVELYINCQYQGVYLISENIKISKNRVNIPSSEDSYLIEIDEKFKENEQVIFSNVLDVKKPFRIHEPKNTSEASMKKLAEHIQNFERFLLNAQKAPLEEIGKWIDIDAFAKHFWVQELTKNPDANYNTSVYFTWLNEGAIQMGPVWDFDIAYGGHYDDETASFQNWQTKHAYWNAYLFSNKDFQKKIFAYWNNARETFSNAQTLIDSLQTTLKAAAENNFRRWDILQEDGKWISNSVNNYEEATKELKNWIQKRTQWIDLNVK